jgi:hypothetical protein
MILSSNKSVIRPMSEYPSGSLNAPIDKISGNKFLV